MGWQAQRIYCYACDLPAEYTCGPYLIELMLKLLRISQPCLGIKKKITLAAYPQFCKPNSINCQ